MDYKLESEDDVWILVLNRTKTSSVHPLGFTHETV